MKILLLNQTFYPDALATSQQVTDLAVYLKKQGHLVTVVCDRSDYESRTARFLDYEQYEGVEIHRVRATGFGKTRFRYRIFDGMSFCVSAFFKMLSLSKQDVVVSFTSPPLVGFPGAVYSALTGAHSVQWLMDINPDAAIAVRYLKETSVLSRILLKVFTYTMRTSAAVVVLDRWMKERVIRRGADPSKIVIIPPWPAHRGASEQSSAGGERFRSEQGLSDKKVIMYSGNHSVVHPLDTLLEAAVRLKDDPTLRFVFVGGGLRVRDVSWSVEQHGLRNVLQLSRQPRERLSETLAAADFHVVVLGDAINGLVHASKIYGVLEAGGPFIFIGKKDSHMGDLLKECPVAFQVDHGDVDGLVRVLHAAIKITPEQRANHARAVQRLVRERYDSRIALTAFEVDVLGRLCRAGIGSVENHSSDTTERIAKSG